MSDSAAVYREIVQSRRSVRKYDSETPFDHEVVSRALDLTLLSPNSSNMQLWEFHRIIDADNLKQAAHFCMGQNAATTARELVVFVVTPYKWRERAEMNAQTVRDNFAGREDHPQLSKARKYYEKLIPFVYNNDSFGLFGLIRKLIVWGVGMKRPIMREVSKSDVRVSVHKSCALAAMNFMMAMRSEGLDTCPMEGFDSKRMKQLLGLPKQAEITMVIGCGKRTDKGVYGERHRVEREDVIHIH